MLSFLNAVHSDYQITSHFTGNIENYEIQPVMVITQLRKTDLPYFTSTFGLFSGEPKIALQTTSGDVIGFVLCSLTSKLRVLRRLITDQVTCLQIL